MPLTANQKQQFAKYFVRVAYKKLNLVASVDVPAIETAVEEIYDYLNSAGVQTAINNEFTEPFKSNASASEKAIVLAAAALFLAGELPT